MEKKIIGEVIDVSKWNGIIDWQKVKASGIKGAIVRVGNQTRYFNDNRRDERAHENIRGAIAANLDVGVYIFATAKSQAEAHKEAEWLAGEIEQYKGKLSMPVYYDFEWEGMSYYTRAMLTDIVVEFVHTMESHGWWTGLYAGKYVMRDNLDMRRIGCTIWLAQYYSVPTYDGDFDMWQYTSEAKVGGISGNCDKSHLYRDLPREIKDAGLNGYKKPVKGDVNGDGKVTAEDAREALRQAVGLDTPTEAADVDGDGEVTAEDARQILNDALGEMRLE